MVFAEWRYLWRILDETYCFWLKGHPADEAFSVSLEGGDAGVEPDVLDGPGKLVVEAATFGLFGHIKHGRDCSTNGCVVGFLIPD